MQHDTALSNLSASRLTRAIVKAIFISVPLWGVIGGTAWCLQAAV